MKEIALAVMVVGLCFYEVYRYVEITRVMHIDADIPSEKRVDSLASIVAFVAAVTLILS